MDWGFEWRDETGEGDEGWFLIILFIINNCQSIFEIMLLVTWLIINWFVICLIYFNLFFLEIELLSRLQIFSWIYIFINNNLLEFKYIVIYDLLYLWRCLRIKTNIKVYKNIYWYIKMLVETYLLNYWQVELEKETRWDLFQILIDYFVYTTKFYITCKIFILFYE